MHIPINTGVTQENINVTAEAFTGGLFAQLTANGGVEGGNLGKTTHICLKTTDNKIQIGSADDGNEVVFYQSGEDFANGIVKTRVFLSKGKVHIETGCQDGTVITSSRGICGASGNGLFGNNVSPMPLGNEGFAGRQFFLFAFRNSSGGTGANRGEVYVAAGAVESEVTLLSGDGQTVIDGPYTIPPYGLQTFLTNADSEFQVVATQNVFVGLAAAMSFTNPQYYDMRLVPPLATNLIGQNRNARLSALYDNTEVWWYRQNGEIGKVIVSPGSPLSLYNNVRNLLGDIININADIVPATGGTFTITIQAETTAAINYDANASDILTALSNLTSYSEDDFIVEMTRGDNLGQSNAQVTIYTQGLLGRITGSSITTSLTGNPHVYNLQQSGTAADNAGHDQGYVKQGAIHLVATNGYISCLSGADGAGLEATYFFPVNALTQRVPLYLGLEDASTSQNSSIAIQSVYKGDFKIYNQNKVLKYSGTFDRGFVPDSGKRQLHASAILIANANTNVDVELFEDFDGGYVESDVPINVIVNSDENDEIITGGILTAGDEIVMYGITPNNIRAAFVKASDGFIYKRSVEGIADPNPEQGFIDYNDTTGSISLTADTWTTIPNNGAGAFSNDNYKPTAVTQLMDVSTGEIDPRQLSLGDTIIIRNDFTVNPNTNNALLEFRYILGDGAGEYTLQTTIGRLDDGSGVDYRFSLKPDLIYMGDNNTKDNLITLQVRLSAAGTLTNAGSVIQVIKQNVHGAEKWIKA